MVAWVFILVKQYLCLRDCRYHCNERKNLSSFPKLCFRIQTVKTPFYSQLPQETITFCYSINKANQIIRWLLCLFWEYVSATLVSRNQTFLLIRWDALENEEVTTITCIYLNEKNKSIININHELKIKHIHFNLFQTFYISFDKLCILLDYC